MARKRVSISVMLDDLFNRRETLKREDIEEVANIFGLETKTIIEWLHRTDPEKKD